MALRIHNKNNRGASLIIVIIAVVVLSILGTAMVSISVSDTRIAARNQAQMQAYYLAWTGANAVAEYITNNPDSLPNMHNYVNQLIASAESKPIYLDDSNGHFRVQLARNNGNIEIKSTGQIGNISKVVTLVLNEITGWDAPEFDVAVFSDNSISMDNNSRINGGAGTNSNEPSSIEVGNNAVIDGNIMVGPTADKSNAVNRKNNSVINGTVSSLSEPKVFPLPPFPEFPDDLPAKASINKGNSSTGSISGNGKYDVIQFGNNSTLTINLNGETKILVNQLKLGNNSHIKLQGNGTLILYIQSSIVLGNNSTINSEGNASSLFIFFKSSNKLNIENNNVIKGSIYAESADIIIENNSSLTGHIITGGSKISIGNNTGADVRALYAPNGKVELKNNVHIKGAVIGENVEMENNTKVTYDPSIDDGIEIPGLTDVVYSRGFWKGGRDIEKSK